MDQAIYISSSESDDEPVPFPEVEEWLAYINADGVEGDAPERPFKRQKVRGPDDAALVQSSFRPPDTLDHDSLRDTQDRDPSPVADDPDRLLSQILETFPGISLAYVHDLIALYTPRRNNADPEENNVGYDLAIAKDAIYEEILAQESYPKEASGKTKRKREGSEEDEGWDSDKSAIAKGYGYDQAAATLLGNEFRHIPMPYIKKVLVIKKRLYHTYVYLYSNEYLAVLPNRQYNGLKSQRGIDSKRHPAYYPILQRELKAAKRHVEKIRTAQRMKQDEEEAEKANEEEHIRTGNLIECQCCYSDVPMNRSLPCEGDELHFFCFSCIRRSADTQIGVMKYTLHCFDSSGCQAPFARSELKVVLGSSIMDKLDSLQQEDEIQKAGLDGLEDCPFCSYKAVLPPVEEDKEFRCENTSCKLVSCRLCKDKSHIPKTCEENRKEKGLSERHQVEEAMSQALIRKCPKCQVQIIKEFGCNKMQCSKCKTMMCYICQKDITKEGYSHFGRGCRQDDDGPTNRDYQEVKKAEQAAIDKILKANPDLTEKQIRVGHQKPQNTRPQAYPGEAWQARGAPPRQVIEAARARRRMAADMQQQAQRVVYRQAQPPAQNGTYAQNTGQFQPVGQPVGQPVPGLQAVIADDQRGIAAQPAIPRAQNMLPQFNGYNAPDQFYGNVPMHDPNAGFQLAGDPGQLPQDGAMQGQNYYAMPHQFYGPF